MRIYLVLCYVAVIFSVSSSSAELDTARPGVHKQQEVSQKDGTPRLDTSGLERALRESLKEASERPDPYAQEKAETDRQMKEYTRQLAEYTDSLSIYTRWLFIATVALAGIGIWQGRQLKRTVDIAVVEAQPVLFPYVVNMDGLHPLPPEYGLVKSTFSPPPEFTSVLLFNFENYGKTPGIVRRVRAGLFVTENDAIPKANVRALPIIHYQETIPGETKAEDLKQRVAADLRQRFAFATKEFQQLLSEAAGNFRRYFLVGLVIYDDFYGIRHTRRFCIKLRLTHEIRFQAQHGGTKYNSIERRKIPKNDPLDKDA